MNTFFEKRLSDIKNEIDFIISNRRDVIKVVEVINEVNVGSDHRMVRDQIKLQLRR